MHSTSAPTKSVPTDSSASDHRMMTGAEAIAEILSLAGIRTIFAYPGTSEIPLCEAISLHNDLTLINSRGDKEAAFMAAGGNLGGSNKCAAILHAARGLTNALGAVAEVRRDEIPVLYIVGLASRASAKYLPPHGEPDLIQSAGAFAKAAYDCSAIKTAEEFLEIVTKAVTALSELPLGPVLLGVPQDVLSNVFVSQQLISLNIDSENQAEEQAINAAVEAIKSSARPVLLVDDYAFRLDHSAEPALAAFSNTIGAPVFQVEYRRGPMLFQQLNADHVQNYAGHYQPTNVDHFQMIHSADLLITIEDRNMYPRVIGPLPECRTIAVTSNARATSKNGYLNRDDILLEGDIAINLARLTDKLRVSERAAIRETENIEEEQFSCCPSASALVNSIANGLRNLAQPIIVDDSQMFGGLIAKHYSLLPRPTRVFGSHGGFVGGGLPIAVGLAAACPDESIICTLGDQGFTNGLQALAVVGEQQVPLLILVCNNGSSVSLRKQAKHEGLNSISDSFLGNNSVMNYSTIAKGFGLSSAAFEWPGIAESMEVVIDAGVALTDAIKDAISTRRPYLLELLVPSDLSFWEGIWNVQGLEGLSAMAKHSEQEPSFRAA